jgi:hypothetical protein
MQCPRCTHAITLGESFRIHNPFDFACPRCVAPLRVGKRGRTLLVASALGGLLSSLWIARLWLNAGLNRDDSFFTVVSGLALLAVAWQWLVLRLSDAQSPKARSELRQRKP